jgi:hypothetical protein
MAVLTQLVHGRTEVQEEIDGLEPLVRPGRLEIDETLGCELLACRTIHCSMVPTGTRGVRWNELDRRGGSGFALPSVSRWSCARA